jgi:hypothetical protein
MCKMNEVVIHMNCSVIRLSRCREAARNQYFRYMNREEALTILQLPDTHSPEDWTEALEQKLFEHKNDVLQKYMVPTLLYKKIKQLEPLENAHRNWVRMTFWALTIHKRFF